MGYRVPKQPYGRGWKLLFEVQEQGKRRWRGVPVNEWQALGFRPSMTREEAQTRASQLNATVEVRRQEKKRQATAERLAKEDTKVFAHLPADLVAEFEADVLDATGKVPIYWQVARRIIAELAFEPNEWDLKAKRFYAHFAAKGYSLNYVQKLIQVMNKWGKFVCRKRGQYFEPIPYPEKHDRKRLFTAHQAKEAGPGNRESAPLSPERLEKARSSLRPDLFNWLFIAVWTGLRPEEVDNLHTGKHHRFETRGETTVLWVKQTKLHFTEEEKLWKPILLFRPEQQQLAAIIESGAFKRPLTKTLQAHFKELGQIGTYCGRKGFQDLMLGFGRTLEEISVWMGHADISRTWKSYKNKQKVNWAT